MSAVEYHDLSAVPEWRVSLFGCLRLRPPCGIGNPSTPVVSLPRRAQRLVAFLALHGPMPRLLIAEALWPETTERLALSNLRSTTHQVRLSCPGLLSPAMDPLDLGTDTSVDVRQVHELWEPESRTAERVEPDHDAERVRVLLEGGELLPGWYDDWVLDQQERMRQLRLVRLEEMALRCLRSGQPALALSLAQAATRLDPLHESAQRTLIEVHLEMGNRIDALRAYTTFRTNSQREFGVGPSARLEMLVRPLLAERNQGRSQPVTSRR